MDKDKRLESHGQSSWLEMQQFIGDLLTSGGPQHHQDAFHLAWGVAGGVAGPGADALGLKGASLAPLAQSRAQDRAQDRALVVPQHQDKTDPAAHHRQTQAGTADRTGQMRDRRGGGDTSAEHHGCTCPGCPFSSPPPVFETLKPRQPPAPLPHLSSSSSRLPKPLGGSSSSSSTAPQGLCLPVQDPSEPCSSTTAQDGDPRGAGDPLSPGQASDQTSSEGSGSRGSPPPHPHPHPHHHLPMFPCLCSLQTCAQLLGQQEGADSSHGRHHFHPCAFAACLPCPQLSARHRHHHHHPPHGGSRAHPPQAAFPCYAFATCAHLCRQQHGGEQQQRAQGAGGGRGTSSSSLPHPCMHCPASFARPSQLLHHQRSEHANKQGGFICTECGRSFNSHSNLRIHLNVHTGARPYACADCGKGFSQSGALKIHRRIHTGERPYSCNYCGRGFPHLAGVRAHQRTHTGEKPYHCTQCGKSFTQSGALKIHVRIHTGERPFLCSLCGKAFSNRSGIRFHYRAVHGILPEPPTSSGAAGGLYRGPAPGRPRGSTSSSSRGAAGGDTSQNAAAGSSRAPADDNKPRPGAGLPYACEDCGLCFKDAPSRNRHQALTHYSEGAGEGETAPEDRLNVKE